MPKSEKPAIPYLRSVLSAATATLLDLRVWVVVIPALALCGLAVWLAGPRMAAALSLAIGLLASHLLTHVEKLPAPVVNLRAWYFAVISPAFVGVLVVNGSAIPARLYMMIWHWFHASKEAPSCGALLTGAAFDWFGCLVVGAILASLIEERATFAAMVGITAYLSLELTEMVSTDVGRESLSVLTGSCSWLRTDEPPDYDSFRFGFMLGMVSRALLILFVTRWASRLVRRNRSAPESPNAGP